MVFAIANGRFDDGDVNYFAKGTHALAQDSNDFLLAGVERELPEFDVSVVIF